MTDEPIDTTAEEMPEAPAQPASAATLALRPHGSTSLIQASTPAEQVRLAAEMATELDNVIKARGMRTKVGRHKVVGPDGVECWEDKFHINVEAWQTLATFLGLAVVAHEPQPIRNDDNTIAKADYEVVRERYPKGTTGAQIRSGNAVPESVERAKVTGDLGYTARVEVFKNDTLIAAGNSRCDRNEESWRNSDAYALEGMAQTRATSRSIAGAARWIVALAGYSSTPAEEMPANQGGGDEMPRWAAPASDELSNTVAAALSYLISDPAVAGATLARLTADTDGVMTAAVARAVVMTISAYKDSLPADPAPAPDEPEGEALSNQLDMEAAKS